MTAIAVGLVCLLLSTVVWQHAQASKPPGEAPAIEFPSAISQATRIQLLQDDFKIVSRVEDLPRTVLETFKEKGGSRLLLANPGAKFNPGDVIWDASVPQRRLVLAGVSKDKCFVHFERGGRGLSNIIEDSD